MFPEPVVVILTQNQAVVFSISERDDCLHARTHCAWLAAWLAVLSGDDTLFPNSFDRRCAIRTSERQGRPMRGISSRVTVPGRFCRCRCNDGVSSALHSADYSAAAWRLDPRRCGASGSPSRCKKREATKVLARASRSCFETVLTAESRDCSHFAFTSRHRVLLAERRKV